MLKVLLVDDEPFILQGLHMLIDWKKAGFEIVKMAENGYEAYEYVKSHEVDMIIADIKMPVMTGLELLEKVRIEQKSEIYFVILSGYADFAYAQQAIRYDCTDYILKPVDKDGLLEILSKVVALSDKQEQKKLMSEELERSYLSMHLSKVILGKNDASELNFVRENMHLSKGIRYVEFILDEDHLPEDISDEELRIYQKNVYAYCREFLKEDRNHAVYDTALGDAKYDVGFVFCESMAQKEGCDEKKYLENCLHYLSLVAEAPVSMLVGEKVANIQNLAKSYSSVCRLRSFQGFCEKKDIYYYEEEVQIKGNGVILCKEQIDELLHAVEENEPARIRQAVDVLYNEMHTSGIVGESMNMNINYLLFQMIHLATAQDHSVNQEEILRNISESTFETGVLRGSKAHILKFACQYGDYLSQLRKNVSKGVIGEIEREIKENYAQNLTLKGLSEKYYVNSAYLGQLFRKKYGCSFKDYLNNWRIEQAATLLIRTDQKIYQVAESVGYHDMDYFVNRFIATKGCTPAKYRKQVCQEG